MESILYTEYTAASYQHFQSKMIMLTDLELKYNLNNFILDKGLSKKHQTTFNQ